MRYAILGGSFNPIHLGHLFLADTVLSGLNYDRVILIPAFQSPFKPGALDVVSARDRLDMLAASVAGDPRLTIDDCEIRREGVSYTIDTLEYVIRRYLPEGKPGLIMGDDLAADFPRWRQSAEITEQADLIIARRLFSGEHSYPYPCRQIKNETMTISSAMVREYIAVDKGWRYLVPAGARSIIEDRGLYGLGNGAAGASADGSPPADEAGKAAVTEAAAPAEGISQELLVRLENTARESLSPGRFLHSRNTALLAWDLCRRFGMDPRSGYLAGITHDLGKPLDEKTLLELAGRDGGEITRLERKKPSLLHGRAAAVLLRERFGIHNKDILEAVAWHTEGSADMGPLGKALYIADKIEVSREGVEPELREAGLAGTGPLAGGEPGEALDRLFAAALNETVSFLKSKKMDLSEETLRLLEKMKGKTV
ncbi:MAG: nicotinate (nicotinamide) nucleotide adenylyltransferase [Treponema sp.]|jgi:nicotinate-nucleotide adenylyltransferase|nr:nicotinate (nicotinamide) nucleotide adenylyltransferase [Treponema sp.]